MAGGLDLTQVIGYHNQLMDQSESSKSQIEADAEKFHEIHVMHHVTHLSRQ